MIRTSRYSGLRRKSDATYLPAGPCDRIVFDRLGGRVRSSTDGSSDRPWSGPGQSTDGLDDALLLEHHHQLRIEAGAVRYARRFSGAIMRLSACPLVVSGARGRAVQLVAARYARPTLDRPGQADRPAHQQYRIVDALGDAEVGSRRRRPGLQLYRWQRRRSQRAVLGARLQGPRLPGEARPVPGGPGRTLRRQSERRVHRYWVVRRLGRGPFLGQFETAFRPRSPQGSRGLVLQTFPAHAPGDQRRLRRTRGAGPAFAHYRLRAVQRCNPA